MMYRLSAALLLPSLWGAFAIDKPLMRTDSSLLHLAPAGESVDAAMPSVSARACPAFILGVPDTNDCKDKDLQKPILTESMCRAAATGAVATAGDPARGLNFTVDFTHITQHPIGCFKDKENPGAFFFNPNANAPFHPEKRGGTPVCERAKFIEGKIENKKTVCPTDYEAVLAKDDCRTAADCEGLKTQEDLFEVGVPTATAPGAAANDIVDPRPVWARTHDTMVNGCFLRLEDETAYWNKPTDALPSGPTGGTPICAIATMVQ